MKVYIPILQKDPHDMDNPFVYTLTDCIQSKCLDLRFEFGLDLYWRDECESIDIIHFMWPDVFERTLDDGEAFKNRLMYLKTKGVKIISTCHNLYAHVKYTIYSDSLYDWVYESCDCIVHMGKYSLDLFQHRFPNISQIIIPHHVYDTVYQRLVDKADGLTHLNLSPKYRYILCLGAFRTDEEKRLVEQVALALYDKNVRIIAPNIMRFPIERKNPKMWINSILEWIKYRFKFGMIVKGRYISDADICFYYGASDISLIQRIDILNSGNVPLGFYMGKVVAGPNVGNVAISLNETNNPVFDPHSIKSVIESVNKALTLVTSGLGENNRRYSLSNLLTSDISEQYMCLYKTLCGNS